MESLAKLRSQKRLSQRHLASRAKISYKTLQLIESGGHDAKVSTLESIAKALGLPQHLISKKIGAVFSLHEDSIAVISEKILEDGEDSWKVWLFNFVDRFRSKPERSLIDSSPCEELSPRIKALLASATETLCMSLKMESPSWCDAIGPLEDPWFVAEVESLKALSLIESPVYFRKRNIFVLGNFLSRA